MSMKRIIPLLILFSFVLSACSGGDGVLEPPGPDVIASYDGGVITKAQLQAKFDSLMPCCKARYQGVEGRKNLIKELVLPEVIARAIKQQKIDLRQNIKEELGNLTDELNMSFLHMKFHEQILYDGDKYKDLRQRYEFQKRQLEGYPLAERYSRLVKLHQNLHGKIADEVKSVSQRYIQRLRKEASIKKNYDLLRVRVSREELKDFYHRHQQGLHGNEYREPERIRILEIEIKVGKAKGDCPSCPEDNKEQAKARAVSALSELRSGASFETVAKIYADESSRAIKSKWIVRGEESAEFEAAVFALDVNEVSDVIEKQDAFSIVRVLEKRPERFKPYEEIVEPLTREYQWQKAEQYLIDNRDRILFTINGKPYTIADFSDEYHRNIPPHKCHHMKDTEMQMMGDEKTQMCDLAHNEFEELKTLMDRMIDKELITEDTYNQMIDVEHKKEIEFLTMATLYPIFHREEMDRLINITDQMVKDYYEKHKESYHYPARAKLSMIVVRGGEREEKKKKAYEKAKKAYNELKPSFFSFKKGRDFSDVARQYSEDPETAPKGGRLDVDVYECRNAIEYMLLHGFHKKIFSLKPGDISDVFEFGQDYYIVQIREMESRKQATFDEVRQRVKQDLMEKEHQKVMVNWEDDLLKSAGFTLYEKPLKELLAAEEGEEKFKES